MATLPTRTRPRNEKTRDVRWRLPFRHARWKIAGTVAPSGIDAAPAAATGEPRAEFLTAEFADASLWELGTIDRHPAAPVRTYG